MHLTFIILIIIFIVYIALFRKPKHHSVNDLKNWFNAQLTNISLKLEADIELDKKGHYPHTGQQNFERRGKITYVLKDKNYIRFDISDTNAITVNHITSTDGYNVLLSKVNDLNLTLNIDEITVDGDCVETFDEIDEYIDDFPRYYTITISGW